MERPERADYNLHKYSLEMDKYADHLEAEVERLKESISRIFRVGHNDDCIFCGIKDREAKRAREE